MKAIAVIADAPETIESWRHFLQSIKMAFSHLKIADSPETALDLCRERSPNCVLIAFGSLVPEKLIREIAARNFPVLAISETNAAASAVAALKAGVSDFLVRKNLDAEALRRSLEENVVKNDSRCRANDNATLESEERYQMESFQIVAQVTNDAIWNWDLKTNRLSWNEGVRTLFGYLPEQVSDSIDWWYEHIHPDERDRVVAGIHKVIDAGEQKWTDEYRFIKSDGTFADVLDRGLVIRDADGEPTRMLGGMTDMTERRLANEKLRASEAHYRNLFESNPHPMWIYDLETLRFLSVNDAAVAHYGYSREEFLAMTIADIRPPEDASRLRKIIFESEPKINRAGVWRHLKKDGAGIEVEITTHVLDFDERRSALVLAHDVTEQRSVEKALRESEERYRALFDSIDEGFCTIEMLFDANGKPFDYRILQTSPSFERQSGVENAIGKTIREIAPQHEEYWFEIYGRVAMTGEPIRFENYADALRRWFDVYAFRIGDQRSRRVGVLFNDITVRKRAEDALRESEQRQEFLLKLSDALNQLADPIEIQSVASRVLGEHLAVNRVAYFEVREDDYVVERDYVNCAMNLSGRYPVSSFGSGLLSAYQNGETVSAEDVTVDEQLSRTEQAGFAAIQTRAYIGVPLIKNNQLVAGLAVHSSLPRRWTNAEIAVVKETAERTWATVERARAEETVRESERRLLQMADAMPQVVWIANNEGAVIYYNSRVRGFAGIEQTPEGNWDWQPVLHPDDLAATAEAWQKAVREKKPYVKEHRVMMQKGGFRWHLSRGFPILDEHGNVSRWYGTATDIHEIKEAEAERERLFESEQKARELAEQANRAKDEFLAVLSHELRTPLNAIYGWTQILEQSNFEPNQTRQAIEIISRNVRLQNALIEDLLDVSRIISGKMRLECETTSLISIIQSALAAARPAAEKQRVRIEPALDTSADEIFGDKHRLQQIISNLLTNAIKFTPAGGSVKVELQREGEKAKLKIQDTGIGIAPDLLPHIFDQFRQADASSKRKFGGLGLGLTIVKHLVELHGGAVFADSEGEGRGAIFTIELPLAAPKITHADLKTSQNGFASEAAETKPLAGAKILIVDDDSDALDLMCFVLDREGANVVCCQSAKDALQALENSSFDLLISDLGMSEMDGYELIRTIRARENGGKSNNLPAIALTGYVSADDRERVLTAGFQTHLAKPVNLETLSAAARELIEK